jgi:hypothetical protein
MTATTSALHRVRGRRSLELAREQLPRLVAQMAPVIMANAGRPDLGAELTAASVAPTRRSRSASRGRLSSRTIAMISVAFGCRASSCTVRRTSSRLSPWLLRPTAEHRVVNRSPGHPRHTARQASSEICRLHVPHCRERLARMRGDRTSPGRLPNATLTRCRSTSRRGQCTSSASIATQSSARLLAQNVLTPTPAFLAPRLAERALFDRRPTPGMTLLDRTFEKRARRSRLRNPIFIPM